MRTSYESNFNSIPTNNTNNNPNNTTPSNTYANKVKEFLKPKLNKLEELRASLSLMSNTSNKDTTYENEEEVISQIEDYLKQLNAIETTSKRNVYEKILALPKLHSKDKINIYNTVHNTTNTMNTTNAITNNIFTGGTSIGKSTEIGIGIGTENNAYNSNSINTNNTTNINTLTLDTLKMKLASLERVNIENESIIEELRRKIMKNTCEGSSNIGNNLGNFCSSIGSNFTNIDDHIRISIFNLIRSIQEKNPNVKSIVYESLVKFYRNINNHTTTGNINNNTNNTNNINKTKVNYNNISNNNQSNNNNPNSGYILYNKIKSIRTIRSNSYIKINNNNKSNNKSNNQSNNQNNNQRNLNYNNQNNNNRNDSYFNNHSNNHNNHYIMMNTDKSLSKERLIF